MKPGKDDVRVTYIVKWVPVFISRRTKVGDLVPNWVHPELPLLFPLRYKDFHKGGVSENLV